ncbi:MAG: YbhB/YbcL family Raf kinase inhibitor-like protein [Acidobacteriaceae bacterium]|nr:YbhB/YbcL family Raf kinase inhibitor-like protein [Acidobacteriaceae bacterium]
MESSTKRRLLLTARIALALCVLTPTLIHAADDDHGQRHEREFRVRSATFKNDSVLPISTIHNIIQNGSNACSVDGSPGGNESPELSWTHAPSRTRSFVVIAYDVTAAFTHWGIYNISPAATGLPANAGIAGSTYGEQISNDFGDLSYDGPCPPKTLMPFVHQYVFTVYALDIELQLFSASADFPAGAETLYHALIEAGRHGHVLETAQITGLYSAVPGQ